MFKFISKENIIFFKNINSQSVRFKKIINALTETVDV